MIVVTGGAGFIGSNIVAELNRRGETDIVVVDDLADTGKIRNLSQLRIADYMDKSEFLDGMQKGMRIPGLRAVMHQGACSDTMATDGAYVMRNNFTYSKQVMAFCKARDAQFIYASSASVYGDGTDFVESPGNEKALNAYAWSKLAFDQYMRKASDLPEQWAGLRYFNVYGPGEGHKQRMASVAWHFARQYQESGAVNLFEGSGGYANGEQRRDFIHVADVVKVNLFFLDSPEISGIFNVGTGRCQSFNEVAVAVINTIRAQAGEAALSLAELVRQNRIQYVPIPEALGGKYQSFTEADMTSLQAAGYDREFASVDEGVAQYISWMASASGGS